MQMHKTGSARVGVQFLEIRRSDGGPVAHPCWAAADVLSGVANERRPPASPSCQIPPELDESMKSIWVGRGFGPARRCSGHPRVLSKSGDPRRQ